jgi:hypothetical protein
VLGHIFPGAVTTYLLHSLCRVCECVWWGAFGGVSACAAYLLCAMWCCCTHWRRRCSPSPRPSKSFGLACFVSWTDERGSSSGSSSRATGWLGCIFVGVAEWAGGRIKQEVSTAKVVQCYPWARQAEGDRDKARRHRPRQGGGRGVVAGCWQGGGRVVAGRQQGGRERHRRQYLRVGEWVKAMQTCRCADVQMCSHAEETQKRCSAQSAPKRPEPHGDRVHQCISASCCSPGVPQSSLGHPFSRFLVRLRNLDARVSCAAHRDLS